MSLIRYEYRAVDGVGECSVGTVEAASEHEAYRRLAARGLTPVHLSERRERAPLLSFNRLGSRDVSGFTRELGVLLEARIPLSRGLASIAEHDEKAAMRTLVRQIAVAVEAGMPLTEALAQHRDVFGDVYIETIRAAERSGNLAAVVQHLADLLERQAETRQMLKRALTYPVIVMAVIAAAVAIIFVFVVPRFAATFESQGVRLPMVTRVVQGIAASVRGYWYAYLGAAAATAVTLLLTWRSDAGRRRLESLLIRLPYIGRILLADTTARFSSIMAIGLSSGLDVIESIEMSGRASGGAGFRSQTHTMAERLRGGAQLAEVLSASPYLPSFARRMLTAGKDARELGKACEAVGRHYEREQMHLMKNISTMIEPLLTVALAGIVLVVALSVFLPMWEMIRIRR